jgi:RNA 2',3'-cyclic 3'-phosphodiesterase
MNTIRTFVAVDVAEAVRRRAARLIELLAQGGGDVKWVEPQNMHLTLQFLGDVPQSDVSAVCQAVERAVEGTPPFSMTLVGAGAFPHPGRPNTIWIGIGEGSEELVALQRAVQRALKPLGFPPERRAFHPHLTIGRMRRGGGPARQGLAQALREQHDFEAGSSMVDQVIVYASYLDRAGPTYQAMRRIDLTGDPPPAVRTVSS